jgi:outer membrane protein TolC
MPTPSMRIKKAEQSAADSLKATRHNVELGLASYLALLTVQRAYSQEVAASPEDAGPVSH